MFHAWCAVSLAHWKRDRDVGSKQIVCRISNHHHHHHHRRHLFVTSIIFMCYDFDCSQLIHQSHYSFVYLLNFLVTSHCPLCGFISTEWHWYGMGYYAAVCDFFLRLYSYLLISVDLCLSARMSIHRACMFWCSCIFFCLIHTCMITIIQVKRPYAYTLTYLLCTMVNQWTQEKSVRIQLDKISKLHGTQTQTHIRAHKHTHTCTLIVTNIMVIFILIIINIDSSQFNELWTSRTVAIEHFVSV